MLSLAQIAASSGMSGPQQCKTPKFPRKKLHKGVADIAVLLKEIVPHFWVFREKKSSAWDPFCLVSQQEEEPPPQDYCHSFQTYNPSELLRNFWEFSQEVQSFYFS